MTKEQPSEPKEAFMDVRYLKKLIKVVEESEISELEIEDQAGRVKIVKHQPGGPAMLHAPVAMHHTPQPAAPPAPAESGAAAAPVARPSNLKEVKSPMVGTFYRAPSPGADSFVNVGDRVKLGQTLCILEAMKLMNELECEVAGVVREVCVENGQPVEYGTTLFLIDPEG